MAERYDPDRAARELVHLHQEDGKWLVTCDGFATVVAYEPIRGHAECIASVIRMTIATALRAAYAAGMADGIYAAAKVADKSEASNLALAREYRYERVGSQYANYAENSRQLARDIRARAEEVERG